MHDDGVRAVIDTYNERQHGVHMGIDENNILEVYECCTCNPGAHHVED